MKMVAKHTIHCQRQIDKSKDRKDRDNYAPVLVAPGKEFDTEDFGISDDEARALIDSGAAEKKVRRERGIEDDPRFEPLEVAHNTAPRGPMSGATSIPDPQKVATDKGQLPKK